MPRFACCMLVAAATLFIMAGGCGSPPDKQYRDGEGTKGTLSYNFDIRPILSDKCFACHGPDANKREADFRLDIEKEAYSALKENPGRHGIVPGQPSNSEVFLRISAPDTSLLMPPPSSNLKLSDEEVHLIERWIKQGAKYEPHWAFVPPVHLEPPTVRQSDWPSGNIDLFVLAAMERQGLQPNKESDPERLLKRVSLDITGLPPSPEMMDRFLADDHPDAFERIVDELLALPAYGEHMASQWLDVARYADSHGYQDDNFRSQWPWRDWVIHAFNNNYSYEKFVTMQLAGDLMPEASKEHLLATGFNRNHKITEEGGVIDEEYRVEYATDRTNTFGKAFLGITMECSKCHDHKYDPISQKEYFEMFSFFNTVKEKGIQSAVGGPDTWAKKPLIEIKEDDLKNVLHFINKPDTNRLIVSVMDNLDSLRKTHILLRGEYDAKGEEVKPGTPASIMPFNENFDRNRLGLAKWLFDKNNPLTSRVFVNQVWQEFFGKGLVKTAGDFGMQGDLPTHPQLLDWLAVDFINHGWDIKRLVKQLVMSSTYRQSSVVTPEKLNKDPENIYLSRSPRYRIKAEMIRDLVLASSGLLNREIGGPSVKPYQPPGLWEGATSGKGLLANYKQDHGDKLYRRGLYTFIKRTVPPPSMIIFDASGRDVCEVTRLKTNTPLQALVMMNDPAVMEASRVLAERLLQSFRSTDLPEKEVIDSPEKMTGDLTEKMIGRAFRLIVCRRPKQAELNVLTAYYKDLTESIKPGAAEKILSAGEYPRDKSLDVIAHAALTQVVSTMYNLEETITKS